MLLDLAYTLLAPLARRLPPRLAYPLADLAMDAVFLAWPRGRRNMRDNLRTILRTDNPATLDYWAQRQLRRYGEFCLDTLRMDGLTGADCVAALDVDPAVWPRLRARAAQGPLIFTSLHTGNWDLAAAACAHELGPLTVLVQSLGHPALDAAFRRQRRRLGVHPIDIGRGLRPTLRILRAGGAVGLLLDRPLAPHQPGLNVTFCDRPCRLPAGLAPPSPSPLAPASSPWPSSAATAAPSASASEIDPSFTYEVNGDRHADAQALTQALITWFEGPVRRHPDQWYMFRRFFSDG